STLAVVCPAICNHQIQMAIRVHVSYADRDRLLPGVVIDCGSEGAVVIVQEHAHVVADLTHGHQVEEAVAVHVRHGQGAGGACNGVVGPGTEGPTGVAKEYGNRSVPIVGRD